MKWTRSKREVTLNKDPKPIGFSVISNRLPSSYVEQAFNISIIQDLVQNHVRNRVSFTYESDAVR